LEITGGNAEGAENSGIAEKATRKVMQGKKLKIDGSRRPTEVRRVGDEGKAIAMAGWGHLCLPFMRPRSGGARL
jgi:hypothetical protein